MIYIGGDNIKKYTIVMQEESKDCGVACIQMIIKYYGGYVKKSNLLELTKTGKNGTTAYNIKEALTNLGFDAKGISCELKDINKENIIFPFIASVTIDNTYKHFIVVYEINFNKKYLVIGDPKDKIRKISYDEFNKIFNSVIITFSPKTSLPIESDISKINFVKRLLEPHKKILLNIFILSLFITTFSILNSFYTEYMLNALYYYHKNYLIILFLIFFSIYILKIFSDFFRNKLLLYINQKLDLVLTLDVFKNIIKLPYCYYQNRQTGDIISRINDLESIRNMISKVALSIFVDLPLTLVALIILYLINKTLCIIGIIILVLYIIIIVLFKGTFNDYIKKIQIKRGNATSLMVESISGFETLKGLHIEDSIKDRFEKKYVSLLKDIFNYQNLYIFQNLFKQIIDNIGFIVIILVGCILVIDEKMNVGTLFTFTSLLVYFLEPIKNIINLDNTIKEANNALVRILDIMSYEKNNSGIVTKFKSGNIEFKNLDFSFNSRNMVLKNINLCIKDKQKVMVIGKSGSGKSTLFKILMKFYDIERNKVLINNIDLNDFNNNTLNNNILYISQNEILFNDTLYNNLLYGNSNTSKLLEICKMCFVDEIIDDNLGYNMMIEENGFNLSGGERQRIVLSRCLLKKFNILIIDEGLSQVDVDMERKILKNIFKEFKDKTIIFISHRLDNLDLFDKLVKLENGVIINE